MKKNVFFLLAILSLFSCSSNDDSSAQPIDERELHLVVDAITVTVNKPIYFSIQDTEQKEVNAELYIENAQVDNPFIFDKVGTYNVNAKKRGYKDSKMLQVNVLKEVRENKCQVYNQDFEIESVCLIVEQVKVRNNGKEYIVDKVVRWANGDLGNIYNLEFKIKGASKPGRVEVSYFVPNPSIKEDNNKIVHYGERVFPNEAKEVFYFESWIVTDNYDFIRNWKTASSILKLDEIIVPNRGEGVGEIGVDATAFLEIDYKDGDAELKIVYDGDVRFIEELDNKTNGEYFTTISRK